MLEVWLADVPAAREPRSGRARTAAVPARLDAPEPRSPTRSSRRSANEADEPRRARREPGRRRRVLAGALGRSSTPARRTTRRDVGARAGGRARLDRASSRRAPAAAPPSAAARSSAASSAGVDALAAAPDVVVKLDADISLRARPLRAAARRVRRRPAARDRERQRACELEDGEWRPRFNTGASVWGAARAYRRGVPRRRAARSRRSMGWDGIDELKAHAARLDDAHAARTCRSATTAAEGERDGSPLDARGPRAAARRTTWATAPGTSSLRALHHARAEPAALGDDLGLRGAPLVPRRPVCADAEVRAELRQRAERCATLRARRREAVGATADERAQSRRRPARLHRRRAPAAARGRCATRGRGYEHAWVVGEPRRAATSSRCSPASGSTTRTRRRPGASRTSSATCCSRGG